MNLILILFGKVICVWVLTMCVLGALGIHHGKVETYTYRLCWFLSIVAVIILYMVVYKK